MKTFGKLENWAGIIRELYGKKKKNIFFFFSESSVIFLSRIKHTHTHKINMCGNRSLVTIRMRREILQRTPHSHSIKNRTRCQREKKKAIAAFFAEGVRDLPW